MRIKKAMLEKGMRIVDKMAYRFSYGEDNSYEDYKQEGYLALMEAIRKADPKRFDNPWPYIRKWIRGYMLHLKRATKKWQDTKAQLKFDYEPH